MAHLHTEIAYANQTPLADWQAHLDAELETLHNSGDCESDCPHCEESADFYFGML